MPDADSLKRAWLRAEGAAATAELEIRKLGQAAASPEVAAAFTRARALRANADRLFQDLQAAAKEASGETGAGAGADEEGRQTGQK